jgi:hypothetical protein
MVNAPESVYILERRGMGRSHAAKRVADVLRGRLVRDVQ